MTQRQIVYNKATQFAKELEELTVVSGNYLGNNKCHEMAFHNAHESKDNVVVALCFIPNSGVNIHFLNQADEMVIDDTLGYLSQYNAYFKLAEFSIDELLEDYDHPLGASNLLMEFKLNMINALFTEKEQEELQIDTTDI